ncbi:MAG: S-layer homology domain-containing protein [Armatimonadetes bacterium]|nr:S-layer homology domain-containing protein [Armatimonadota bacterium]
MMRVFLALLFLLSSAIPPSPTAPLDEIPETHWAKSAIEDLLRKGILKGAEDGRVHGERPLTRYQMGMIIYRVLKELEAKGESAQVPSQTNLVTKQDIEALTLLAKEYTRELQAIGLRTSDWEETLARYEARIQEAERVRTQGAFRMVAINQSVRGPDPTAGTSGNPVLDFSTGRLLVTGTALEGIGWLRVLGRVAATVEGGADLAAVGQVGVSAVSSYWGVTRPYFTNAFTGLQENNTLTVERLWVSHSPTKTGLSVGTIPSLAFKGHVLKGEPNPVVSGPTYLPFAGMDLVGTLAGKIPITYEGLVARLAQGSPYSARVGGAYFSASFPKGAMGLGLIQASNGDTGASGQVPLPSQNWTGMGTTRTGAGPQQETLWGLDWNYPLNPRLRLRAEYGASLYLPDRAKRIYDDQVSGSLFRFGLSGDVAKIRWGLDLLSIDPTYDPFLLPYPVPPNIPILFPYSTYYVNYYQLHDSLEYPSNRKGFRLNAAYPFSKGQVQIAGELLSQKRSSTAANLSQPGTVEPLFPLLAASDPLGRIESVGLMWTQFLSNTMTMRTDLYRYRIARDSGIAADQIGLMQTNGQIRLEWKPDELWHAFLGYQQIWYEGSLGVGALEVRQTVPSLGLRYALTPNTGAEVMVRWHDFENRLLSTQNWTGTQSFVRLETRF